MENDLLCAFCNISKSAEIIYLSEVGKGFMKKQLGKVDVSFTLQKEELPRFWSSVQSAGVGVVFSS